MKDFQSLGLAEPLLDALKRANYATPTPIQAQAIPLILDRNDVLGIAQTGTGKTAAFALPVLHRLAENRRKPPQNGCRALILAPTRELATQIGQSFKAYGRDFNFKIATIFGGVSPRPQRQALARGIDILIATPGRLIDHMTSGVADLSETEVLVLDEADQMLDLGFLPPLRKIVAAMPKKRQTVLFSATMPAAISKLAAAFLHQPKRISVAPAGATVDRISQRVIHVGGGDKKDLLTRLVAGPGVRTIVFTRTKRGADKVAKHLEAHGASVAAIHGNKSQGQRERALHAFRNARIDILVATDIAARGIDIEAVEHVINYELPDVPEAYVHRIGRTARAGATGLATSLCDASERKLLRDIEKLTQKKIEVDASGEDPGDADVTAEQGKAPPLPSRRRKRRGPGKAAPTQARSGKPGHRRDGSAPKKPANTSAADRGGRRPRRRKAPTAAAKARATA